MGCGVVSGQCHRQPVDVARHERIGWIGIALGVVCTLLATGLGIYGLWYWIDRSNFPGPLLGGVAVLFVLGIQGFLLALVGEYLGRIQREVDGRPLYTIEREL